ncbi:MAG: DUF1304 domain-containing protein [Porcincola intestinalis]|jgi:putative membrane protein|uniref:DUF1304 domain-containing protein n=1 Tax=Porcincola intestinalis TaxID=2606632 RepID=UPI002A90FC62|nr:DUF1304 domain-containing protein [Porcincola intestinalis]MDY5333127.1 DUF1304 domain-containing protein [Porcincola intestinalis]
MNIVTKVLAVLTALEFIYIFYLETVKTDSEKTAKTFGMETSTLKNPGMNVSMKNQGVYNLGIAALIITALLFAPGKLMIGCLMAYIVFVAAYGSMTVSKSIILKQGGLAILALISLLF